MLHSGQGNLTPFAVSFPQLLHFIFDGVAIDKDYKCLFNMNKVKHQRRVIQFDVLQELVALMVRGGVLRLPPSLSILLRAITATKLSGFVPGGYLKQHQHAWNCQ